MAEPLAVRRHLYARMATARHLSRGRRAYRRQIALLSGLGGGDDGPAGVREPRRPSPALDPARAR